MPYPVGGDFLPDPHEGSALDYLIEKFGRGRSATREGIAVTREAANKFLKKFKAAEGWEAKMALIKELQGERTAKKAGYIGLVEVTANLMGEPKTAQFDLQKPVSEKDWATEWELVFRDVEGVVAAQRRNDYTITIELGNYYHDRTRAGYVIHSAAELLHLKLEAPIKFGGEGS